MDGVPPGREGRDLAPLVSLVAGLLWERDRALPPWDVDAMAREFVEGTLTQGDERFTARGLRQSHALRQLALGAPDAGLLVLATFDARADELPWVPEVAESLDMLDRQLGEFLLSAPESEGVGRIRRFAECAQGLLGRRSLSGQRADKELAEQLLEGFRGQVVAYRDAELAFAQGGWRGWLPTFVGHAVDVVTAQGRDGEQAFEELAAVFTEGAAARDPGVPFVRHLLRAAVDGVHTPGVGPVPPPPVPRPDAPALLGAVGALRGGSWVPEVFAENLEARLAAGWGGGELAGLALAAVAADHGLRHGQHQLALLLRGELAAQGLLERSVAAMAAGERRYAAREPEAGLRPPTPQVESASADLESASVLEMKLALILSEQPDGMVPSLPRGAARGPEALRVVRQLVAARAALAAWVGKVPPASRVHLQREQAAIVRALVRLETPQLLARDDLPLAVVAAGSVSHVQRAGEELLRVRMGLGQVPAGRRGQAEAALRAEADIAALAPDETDPGGVPRWSVLARLLQHEGQPRDRAVDAGIAALVEMGVMHQELVGADRAGMQATTVSRLAARVVVRVNRGAAAGTGVAGGGQGLHGYGATKPGGRPRGTSQGVKGSSARSGPGRSVAQEGQGQTPRRGKGKGKEDAGDGG